MKPKIPCLIGLLCAGLLLAPSIVTPSVAATATASNSALLAAVAAADDERCAATQAGDRARLAASYSDDLHYAHSNGKIDNKSSQIEGVINGPNIYEKFDYKDRTFVHAGPGVVLMKGRVLVHMKSKTTGQKLVNDLNYLAVWREENGKWRFLAWQSCKNLPPAPSTPK
jgi:ketosteroid isomerase-like protein